MIDLFKMIFRIIDVKYTNIHLSHLIAQTPYINSMCGICYVLSHYRIPFAAVKISPKESIIEEEDYGIVLYEGEFALICPSSNDSKIVMITPKGEKLAIETKVFLEKWDGSVILIEKKPCLTEPNYAKHHKDEILSHLKIAFFFVSFAALLFSGIFSNTLRTSWLFWSVFSTNIVGVAISYLQLQEQLHIPNPVRDRLCGFIKGGGCNDVVNSPKSTFLGMFKLSEIGSAFFLTNIIFLLFSPSSVGCLALIAVSVLPFSFWSIWYQRYKIRKWCVLCLLTLILMWTQAIMYLIDGNISLHIDWIELIKLISCYGILVFAFNYSMHLIEDSKKIDGNILNYNELRMREDVISEIKRNAPTFTTDYDSCSGLIFGNPNAPNKITIFSNPYCEPCAMMHSRIENQPGENLCVQYVYTYFSEELSMVNKYLIAAYQQLGQKKAWGIMTEWYKSNKTEGIKFFDRFGLIINDDKVQEEFNKHENWRNNDNLRGTPTVIINEKEVTEPYTVEDYPFL